MDWKLICLSLLMGLFSCGNSETDRNRCVSATNCAECIQADPSCAWCSEPSFQRARCGKLKDLRRAGCKLSQLHDPHGSLEILSHTHIPNPTIEVSGSSMEVANGTVVEAGAQVQPRRFSLSLRPGEAWSFSLQVSPTSDQPMDVYYLLDLSPSMKDHLENILQLGTRLAQKMAHITKDLRLGFGLIETSAGAKVPRFRHVLSLTGDFQRFTEAIGQVRSQVPEEEEDRGQQGAVDAIVQVSVCQEEIGWRNGSRLLVYSADRKRQGDFVAGSKAKTCQLQNNVYSPSGSPQHVNARRTFDTVNANDIAVVLAVTDDLLKNNQQSGTSSKGDFIALAQKLIAHHTEGTLSGNSDNLVDLIVNAQSSRGISLKNSPVPEGVTLSYRTRCLDGLLREGKDCPACRNISVGHQVVFNLSLVLTQCPKQGPLPTTISIKPLGFTEQLDIEIKPVCSCDCQTERVENSLACGTNGALECGVCRCNKPHAGIHCETELADDSLYDQCRQTAKSPVCSKHGECLEGMCKCNSRIDPVEQYIGRYCECDNFTCERANGLLCGGHGRCECGRCVCDVAWTGSSCECSMGISSCLASNQLICNNQGNCMCERCVCSNMYRGPTCEDCPIC
ncbi:integrin beta-1-like [Hypomesus transpacificus]|uniref:integrin beta-1-like n=1 Tax=Hypomesus transpacificus TaxID=137520 RepID=UPI001F07EFE2|nr:integrin beta-1-like [Hypomesus transpacificus]